MSFYFLLNNFHFALELTGAVAFLMAAWLTLDTYSLRKDGMTLIRAIGLGFLVVWQVLYAMLQTESDALSYLAFIFLFIGLILILASFLKKQELQMHSIIILPTLSVWSVYLDTGAMILLCAIAYFSFQQSKREFNKMWMPFSYGFLFLSMGTLFAIFEEVYPSHIAHIIEHLLKGVGFVLIVRWVWQYLQLRIRESLILIFISAALFLSTVVTLAFSTILISQITAQAESNLLTNARVLDLHLKGLEEQALAKASLIARDDALAQAVTNNDFQRLSQIAETFLESQSLGFVTITDRDGVVLVRAHALSKRGDSLLGERALEEAVRGDPFVTIEESPVEKLSIRAAAPIKRADKTVGVVIAGYPLDNALVDNIKRITGLEMFLYTGSVSTASTALASDGRTRLTGITLADSTVRSEVLGAGKTTTAQAEFYGQPFLASYLPLLNGDDKIIGMISAAKPQQDILDIANSTNRLTLITVLLILLVLLFPIYKLSKRFSSGLNI